MSAKTKGGVSAAALGALMLACCTAGPALLGAVAGGAIGGWSGVLVSVAFALLAAGAMTWRRRRSNVEGGCGAGCGGDSGSGPIRRSPQ